MTDVIEAGDEIIVNQEESQIVTVSERISYQTEEVENVNLAPGQRVVTREGSDGERDLLSGRR